MFLYTRQGIEKQRFSQALIVLGLCAQQTTKRCRSYLAHQNTLRVQRRELRIRWPLVRLHCASGPLNCFTALHCLSLAGRALVTPSALGGLSHASVSAYRLVCDITGSIIVFHVRDCPLPSPTACAQWRLSRDIHTLLAVVVYR